MKQFSDHKIDPEPFWAMSRLGGADGYDMMDEAAKFNWRAVPSWGRDGWDLGSWPYVVMYHREIRNASETQDFQLAHYVEGDMEVWSFAEEATRNLATDQLAFWYWKNSSEEWVKETATADDMAAHLRGPYWHGRPQ